ncbi:MAG: acyl-CoA dehydrogenase family protein [Halioglobus sp.]
MKSVKFTPLEMPNDVTKLRSEVRSFLNQELADIKAVDKAKSWSGYNAEFSRKLAGQGWIGMIWPKDLGGHEASALHRYVVMEELLAAGAPVAAHWIADRQSGTHIMRYASPDVQKRFLPAIARGEMYFCIGMSEPNSGSDLASIQTKADRVDGGWIINGAKIWTTFAHRSHMMIALVRTTPKSESRHAGLSQFIIDLSADGVTVNPIEDHQGDHHFGEIFLDNVFVADEMLLGTEGDGWAQVNSELALERSGPERYLSSYRLFEELLMSVAQDCDDQTTATIGEITADLWTLRQMSMSIAGQLADGEDPSLAASMVKDLGACFEQNLPHTVQAGLGGSLPLARDTDLNETLSYLLKATPAFSLRGGTREILRGIIAKGLGLK